MTAPSRASLLEQRYRKALLLLPASYRAEREDEMVAVFLEGAGDVGDEDNPKPRLSEIASIAALAVRVRLGDTGPAPGRFALGDSVRLVALLGVLYQAALGCLAFIGVLRVYGVLPTPQVDHEVAFGAPGSAARLSLVISTVVAVVWIACYVTLVRGRPRAAKILALLAVVPGAVRVVGDVLAVDRAPTGGAGWGLVGIDLLTGLLVAIPVLALLTGFHVDAPRVTHPRRWLTALPLAAVLLLPVPFAAQTTPETGPWLIPGGLFCVLLVAAGIGYVCVYAAAPSHRTPVWPLALALLAVPALGARLAHVHVGGLAGGTTAVLTEASAVAVVGVVLLVLARAGTSGRAQPTR